MELKDRISQYPNRIGLTDSNGVKKLYTLSREDNPTEEGTKLNKANLLSDDTASLFGLTNPTVNDYLSTIVSGGFKGFWWKKKEFKDELNTYTGKLFESTSTYTASSSTSYNYIYYAESYETYLENGVAYFRLVNPIKYTASSGTSDVTLKDKYVLYNMAWRTEGATNIAQLKQYSSNTSYNPYLVYRSSSVGYELKTYGIIITSVSYSSWFELIDYVCSANFNAYPNGDYAEDGYYYELDKSVVVDKIYKWRKGTSGYSFTNEYTQTNGTELADVGSDATSTIAIYYSLNVEPTDNNTKMKLVNPQVAYVSYNNFRDYLTTFQNMYFQLSDVTSVTMMYKMKSDGWFGFNLNSGLYGLEANNFVHCQNIGIANIAPYSEVTSINENEYPNGGEQDGYYYDNRETINLGGATIQVLSYVGDGTIVRDSSPKSVQFHKRPKFIGIKQYSSTDISGHKVTSAINWFDISLLSNTYGDRNFAYVSDYCDAKYDDKTNTLYWYSELVGSGYNSYPFNISGYTYYWYGLG